MTQALSRFRMLDLSRQLPGPFCSMLLADLGMDVVVVASPNDPLGMGIPLLGRNKRSLTLNLKDPEGRAIFQRLAKDADVVLEGGRPGGAKKLGVDYEMLRALNPRIVYCSISGYGQDGPYRDRVGHDVNYLGFAGVIDATGVREAQPVIPGVQIADIGAGR
jgi:crotonobetainyl-CoA:carnitine CoA-transferase CaiB-like acyl-CoA transferase